MTDTILVKNAGRSAPRGATIVSGGVNFSVYSETAKNIWVCLFDEQDRQIARHKLDGRDGPLHFGLIRGAGLGSRYGLRADGAYVPDNGLHFDPLKLLVDPYAKRLDRPFITNVALNAPLEASVDTADFVPKAIVTRPIREKAVPLRVTPNVIYELNVRGFSKQHPAVFKPERGQVSALTTPEIADHLAAIGVNVIELMPASAWIDDRHLPNLGLHNAWGYNPVSYMAPDPRLMPRGITDLRDLTDFYRDRNIAVIVDVVFNHTGEGDALGPTLSLRGLDALTYYRYERLGTDLKLINDTGTGNTLKCDHPEVCNLVLDAMRFWVSEGGVSGFRFDLAPIMGRSEKGFSAKAMLLEAMRADPLLSQCLLVAEPWDPGPGGYQLGAFGAAFSEWNDRYRDDVRAFWRGDDHKIGAFASALSGSSEVFKKGSRKPSASVNFIAAHDGFTLRDLVSYSEKHNEANGEQNRDGHSHNYSWNCGVEGDTDDAEIKKYREDDVRALLTILYLSKGTPMLAQGDEMGRTQFGNNNAYAQDNELTWLDWENADENLISFVQKLAQFRQAHPAIRHDKFLKGTELDGTPDVRWLHPEQREMRVDDWERRDASTLGMHLRIEGDELILWFNRSHESIDIHCDLPDKSSRWVVGFASKSSVGARGEPGAFTLPPRSVVALTPDNS